nr:hypothetical protein [Polyangiaceae bacterium]
MTTNRIVSSLFCVASLLAACGTPGDATGAGEGSPPVEAEAATGLQRAGDVVAASLSASTRGERELHYARAGFLRVYFGTLALERGTQLVLEGSGGETAVLNSNHNGEGVWGPSLAGDRVKLRLERSLPGALGSYAVTKVGVGLPDAPDPAAPPDASG